MKLSDIAEELAKLNEPEQEPDEAEIEAEKAELESCCSSILRSATR